MFDDNIVPITKALGTWDFGRIVGKWHGDLGQSARLNSKFTNLKKYTLGAISLARLVPSLEFRNFGKIAARHYLVTIHLATVIFFYKNGFVYAAARTAPAQTCSFLHKKRGANLVIGISSLCFDPRASDLLAGMMMALKSMPHEPGKVL